MFIITCVVENISSSCPHTWRHTLHSLHRQLHHETTSPQSCPTRHLGTRFAENMLQWQSAPPTQKAVAKMRPESGHGNRASERGIHSGMPPSYVPVSCPHYGPKSATTSFYVSMAPLGAQFSTTTIPRMALRSANVQPCPFTHPQENQKPGTLQRSVRASVKQLSIDTTTTTPRPASSYETSYA